MKAVASLLGIALVSGAGAGQKPQAPLTVTGAAPSSPASAAGAVPATQQAPASAAVAPASQAPPPPNTLLDGTPVKMRLAENLSSETNKTGDQVPFEVTEEVDVDGVAVIPKGAQALATVTDAQPKRRMGRGGKLDVNVDSVRLADGEKAQLRAEKGANGGGHVGAMTGAMVGTAIVFFPAAPLFLFMHGKSVEIPKGTEVTAFVQGDMHLTMANFGPKPEPGEAPDAAASAVTATTASLTVESNQAGADIEIDGNFVGNTPSTVSVAAGQHTITVKKKGYAAWSRTMTVSGGSVRLEADLDVAP
ncbi:MAG TPA: PEGA domain-containing protein [Acidobacteriaceae bacterium]|nr:PEGA domain-containing protein [Acidobacteriaceae bacterium]